jgi:hypothetical protein
VRRCGWRIGAPPTPRFGVSEARMQTPGAKCVAGTRRCVCVLEIVRPGMEDSESAEKQENTGIGTSHRVPRRKRVHAEARRGNEGVCVVGGRETGMTNGPSVSCVPDATQRERQRSGASLIRDRHRLKRSRVCSASLRAALRPGHERSTNLRLCEIIAGAISLLWDCYLQWLAQLQRVGAAEAYLSPHMSPTMCHHPSP